MASARPCRRDRLGIGESLLCVARRRAGSGDAWRELAALHAPALALLGAFVSDVVLGKYRTILYFSIVYCGGHLALGLNDTRVKKIP